MKKTVKHPKDMTTDEAIVNVFNPKALKHLKKHVEKLSENHLKRKPK
jgi:hypothetical protein